MTDANNPHYIRPGMTGDAVPPAENTPQVTDTLTTQDQEDEQQRIRNRQQTGTAPTSQTTDHIENVPLTPKT
ncbi:hypothetical protein OB03_01800 [Brevundimonas sp. GN22]